MTAVFREDVLSKLDSLDIVWDDLNWALEGMDSRKVMALRARYEDGLTFEKVGKVVKRKDGRRFISKMGAWDLTQNAIRSLGSFKRRHVLVAAITPIWNLYR